MARSVIRRDFMSEKSTLAKIWKSNMESVRFKIGFKIVRGLK